MDEVVLITSDWHLHDWRRFSKGDGTSALFEAQKSVLKQIRDIAVDCGVSAILHGGDVYHKRGEVPVPAIRMFRDFYDDWSRLGAFLIATGNHDLTDDSVVDHYGDAVTATTHTMPTQYTGSLKIKMISYPDTEDPTTITGYDIVVAHKMPAFSKDGTQVFADGYPWDNLGSSNKTVWFGHNHTRQQMADNVFVIGSVMDTKIGDEGSKGVWLVSKSPVSFSYANEERYNCGGLYIVFIPLAYPRIESASDNVEQKEDGSVLYVDKAEKPVVYDEKIKSVDHDGIMREWLNVVGVPQDEHTKYMEKLASVLKDVQYHKSEVFKGRVKSVELNDFLSYEHAVFTYENGFTMLCGANGSFGSSNGAGKSTSAEALCWCLFGETTKGLRKSELIRDKPFQQKKASVKVELDGVTIIRDTDEGLSVFIDGENIVGTRKANDRQQVLEEQVLGFNLGMFLSSCYFSQENLQLLTTLGDADRVGMLTSLLGFDMYDAYGDAVKKAINKATADAQAATIVYGKAEVAVNAHKETIEQLKQDSINANDSHVQKMNEASEANKNVERIVGELVALKTSADNATKAFQIVAASAPVKPTVDHSQFVANSVTMSEIAGIDAQVYAVNATNLTLPEFAANAELQEYKRKVTTQIASINEQIAEHEAKLIAIKGELVVLRKDADKANGNEVAAKSKVEEAKAELSAIEKTGTCPTCNQTLASPGDIIAAHQKKVDDAKSAFLITEAHAIHANGMVGLKQEEADKVQASVNGLRDLLSAKNQRLTENQAKIDGERTAFDAAQSTEIQKFSFEKQAKISDLTAKKRELENKVATAKALYDEQIKNDNAKIDIEFGKVYAEYQSKVSSAMHAMNLANVAVSSKENDIASARTLFANAQKAVADALQVCTTLTTRLKAATDKLEIEQASYDKAVRDVESCRELETIYGVWRDAFGSKGLKSLLLDRFCNTYNTYLADYIAVIGGGRIKMALSPEDTTATGEKRNKLGIRVWINDTERAYRQFSGGEKRRLDLAICLSLNKWFAVRYNLSHGLLGLLILDELFGFVDKAGEESAALLLQEEGRNKAVVVVSHTSELSSFCDRTVMVSKKDDVSRIVSVK